MSKNIIIAIVAIIALGGGVLLLNQQNGDNEMPTPNNNTGQEQEEETENNGTEQENPDEEEASRTITYTDSGFSPADISISAGTAVIFENESSRQMWVASDSHPTHTLLPEFDNRTGIAPGETYQFTFTETGEWGYHDHLNPTHGGTITVE